MWFIGVEETSAPPGALVVMAVSYVTTPCAHSLVFGISCQDYV